MKMPESDSVSQELRGERTEQPQNTVALGERRGIVQFIKMFIFHNSHGCQSSDGAFSAVRFCSPGSMPPHAASPSAHRALRKSSRKRYGFKHYSRSLTKNAGGVWGLDTQTQTESAEQRSSGARARGRARRRPRRRRPGGLSIKCATTRLCLASLSRGVASTRRHSATWPPLAPRSPSR